METNKTRTYSSQEVNRIMQRALQENERNGIGHEELLEIGRELGLAPQTIEAAIQNEDTEAARQRSVENWRESRKFGFHWHLWSFIIANAMLLLVNALVPGPWWFQWSVIGWGIGLVFHYQRVYFPTHRQVRHAFRNRADAASCTEAAAAIISDR
jgi:hypothetical protein